MQVQAMQFKEFTPRIMSISVNTAPKKVYQLSIDNRKPKIFRANSTCDLILRAIEKLGTGNHKLIAAPVKAKLEVIK